MRIILFLRPFFLIALLLAANSATAEPDPDPPRPPKAAVAAAATTANSTEFIRTSCQTTQYPELCYRSLSVYAIVVQQDPARLARAAVGVSLSRATFMAIYLANLTSQQPNYDAAPATGGPRAVAALRDCVSVFRDAVSQIRGSLKQMHRLDGVGEELRFQVSNVQTWMSAALTYEETCTDGFAEVADNGPVKADVCNRTVEVKEVTSNALALVNSYVNKVTVP